MALTVDEEGKIIEKHLHLDEKFIKEVISKTNKPKHKKILQKASKTKITRRIVS